jgi:hypothetical protein
MGNNVMKNVHACLVAGAALASLFAHSASAGEGARCCAPPVTARPTVIYATPPAAAPLPVVVSAPAPLVAISAPTPIYKVDQGPYYDGPGTDCAPRIFHENQPVRDFSYVSSLPPWSGAYPPDRHRPYHPWRHGFVRARG